MSNLHGVAGLLRIGFFAFGLTASIYGASGTWNGTAPGANGFWTNSLNWSASPAPYGADAALFNNAGNGQTTVDLTGLSFIKNLTFDTSSVAAYTFGTGTANSQTLVLGDNGEIALSAAAGNSQVFNCGVQLGLDRTAQTYNFRNDNPSMTLTFNNVFGCAPEISGSAGNKTLNINGVGPVAILGDIRPNGASALTLTLNNTNTLTLAGSNVLYTLNMYGGPNGVVDIGNKELYLNNAGGNALNCSQGGTINGTGKIRLNTSDGFTANTYNYIDFNVSPGRTLVINPEMTGPGGIETWTGTGIFVLNGINTFESHIIFGTTATIVCSKIGNRGSVNSNLGKGTNLYFNAGGKLVYTGIGEDSNRQIILNNNATIDQSGPTGKLSFSVSPTLASSGTKTLTLQGSTAGVGEFSAPLINSAGTLAVTKTGDGAWILSGTNIFTGATTVNGGTLLVNSPGSLARGSGVTVNNGSILGGNGMIGGTVNLAAGGVLAPGGINTVGTLSLTNNSSTSLTLNGNMLLFDVSNIATDKIDITGTSGRLVLNGTNTVAVSFPDGSAQAGTYTLMSFYGRTGTGTFVLSPAYPNLSLVTNATSVQVVVGPGGASPVLWKGNVSGNWDGADLNWTSNGIPRTFSAGDQIAFDDTAAIFTVTGSAPVTPGSVLFNNSLNDYSVSAALDGTGVVYKLGSGTVTLTGANTHTGAITVASGTLKIGGEGVLGGGNYPTTIVNNGDLIYASSAAQTNSGVISGGGNLTASGGGALTLSGNNTYGGLTLVTNGTLCVRHANALGSTSLGTVVAAGSTLELAGTPPGVSFAAEPLELRGTLSSLLIGTNTFGGTITPYDGAAFNVGPGASLFVSNTTMDNGSNTISKIGAGVLRFTGDPNHRSVFIIAEGTVELQHSGSTDAPWIINPGATLRDLMANDIGDYLVQADGTLDLQVSEGVGGLNGTASGLVTNGSSSAITLTIGNNNQSGAYAGVIRNGAGMVAITKTGTGIQTLSGANTYSGGTTLNSSSGQFNINHPSAIGTGTLTINGGMVIDNTSGSDIALTSNNAQNWSGDFTFIGSKSLNLGTGAVTLNADRSVTVLTNTLSVGGVIGGNYKLTKNGMGTLALSGANTYNGATTVNAGGLLVNSPGSLAGGAVTVSTSALFGGSGTVNGAVTCATNSLLVPGGFNTIGTLTLANASSSALTLNGVTMLFDLSSVAGVSDQIALTGAGSKVVLNGVNRIVLNFPSNGVPAGTYTLISSMAGITTNAGASVVLLTSYPNATLSQSVNSIVLTVTGDGIPGATWTGAASGNWDGSDVNWVTNGSVAVAYPAGAAVVFDDTAVGNFAIGSTGAVAPASVLFNNSANDYSVSAALTGTGPLAKQGSAAVTLSGMTAYNPGMITVCDGSLTLGGASQLNGGSYGGDIFANVNLSYASSADQTYSGVISGNGGLIKYGNGTLTLSGSNLYNGATIVNAGILKLQSPGGLGQTSVGTTVNQGGTLELTGNVNTIGEPLTLYGTLSSQTGSNTFNGSVTLYTGASIDVGTDSTLNLNVFTANGPFTKTGPGWLRFKTDPNGVGTMIVNAGVAELNQSGGAMDANIIVNAGGTLIGNYNGAVNDANRVVVNAGGTYSLRQPDTINALSGAGTVTKDTAGSVTLAVNNYNNMFDVFSGVIQNGAGMLGFSKYGAGTETFSGVNTYTGTTTVAGGALFINSPGSLAAGSAVTVTTATLGGNGTVNGPVTVNAGSFLVPGERSQNAIGTLTLGSTLTLNGATLLCDLPSSGTVCDRVAVSGALTLNGVNTVVLAFPNGAAPADSYTLMTFPSYSGPGTFALVCNYPNASLTLNANSLVLNVSGSGTSALTWNGNESPYWDGGALNWKVGGAADSFSTGDAVTFDDSAATFTVVSGGAVAPSAVVFNNSNNYTVATEILGTVPILKFGSGTALLNKLSAYNPSSININAGTLSFGNAAQLNSGNYAGPIMTEGTFSHSSSASQLLSGIISGSGSFTKYGSGTLTLAGTNTYSGGTTITAGTLIGRGGTTSFGTGWFSFGGGTTELQGDSGLAFVNGATLNASCTIRPGRITPGAGVTHSMGSLTANGYTMTVTNNANVSVNTPYGLTFGTTTIGWSTPTFSVANNGTGTGTLTLGSLVNNYNITKSGNGVLYLGTAGNGNRSSAVTTLSAGTLKLGHAGALGTSGATLSLSGGVLDLAIDTSVYAHNTTVGGSMAIQSDKFTAGGDGITHTLGSLGIGAYTLTVTNGPNVKLHSPFGLTFGTVSLTGNAAFDVGNNGTGQGTLTLGAMGGGYTLTKRGFGTAKLIGVNTYSGATTVNNGKILGVSGGSCAGSLTLQSSGIAAAVAKLGVLCKAANEKWTCAGLTISAASAPATTNPVLEFAFSVTPSTTVAPLQVTGTATFSATPSVTVNLSNLSTVPVGTYPLMLVGGTAPTAVPSLTVIGGYSGSTLSWSGNTLNLNLTGTPTTTTITWSSGASGNGTWDINNVSNIVWMDDSAVATCYKEATDAGGASSRVLFSDVRISADTTVALNTVVTPASVTFTNSAFSYTLTGSGGIAGTIGLTKGGTNLVTFAVANTYTGSTLVAAGTLKLTSGGAINHPAADAVVGSSLFTNALLKIESGASVTLRWLQLGTANGAVGAVYNQGTLAVAGASNVSNFMLGASVGGYGYYRHDTPIQTTITETGIGGAYNGDAVMDVMSGVVTNSTYFQLNRAYSGYQSAELNVWGGSLIMPNNNANAHLFYSGTTYGTGIINVANGGLLGSAGTSTELDLIKASTSASTLSVLNILSGGTVQATRIKASQSAGLALVNFNGGTLKANYNTGNQLLGYGSVDRVTLYAGGATVDTDNKNASITLPLLAPTGNGVTYIPLTANGVGYMGRPIVSIIGGGGSGATAIAEFDPDSLQVTGVTITSPGYGYTSTPTVSFIGGGGTAPTVGTVSIGAVASGGLTKIGLGTLNLSGANTYSGPTIISNGTLRIGSAASLPTNSTVVIAGGVLDLNGFTLTNASINLISGSLINGTLVSPTLQGADAGVIQARIVSTNGLVKEGSDTLILSSPQTYPGATVISGGTLKLSGRQPGLYEGRILGNSFDLTSANPKTATPLSTRYANLYFLDAASAAGIWPDNTTYIYSGYLWNDAATNETWSFFRCFDDSTRLTINGTNVLLNTNMSGITVISNAVMRPGWNLFELRLGEGGGAVGNNNSSFPNMGVGYDRLGRGQAVYANFQTLSDPGDGSLLTLTNVFDLASANILPTNSAVALASGSTLDLGGTGQKTGGLSGSGVVTNGTLSVNGTIAPGGIGTIGTLTLADVSATLSGTLRVDASDDGTCDLLAVTGSVTLSNLSLVVENGSVLDGKKTYTIMTYSGTRTGTFASKVSPSGWGLVYGPSTNGSIKLKYFGGTVLQLR